MAADIAQELEIIRSQAKGDAVKAAIASALQKCAAERGGSIIKEIDHGKGFEYTDAASGSENGLFDCPIDVAESTDDENKTSTSLTIAVKRPALLLATALHRAGDLSVNGSGWTLVAKCGPSDSTYKQYVSAYAKQVTAGSYSVTLSQSSSKRLSGKLIAIYGAESATVADNYGSNGRSSHRDLPAKTGKKRLYLATTVTAPYVVYDGDIYVDEFNQTRFEAFYDDVADENETPGSIDFLNYYINTKYGESLSPGDSSGLTVLSLDIT